MRVRKPQTRERRSGALDSVLRDLRSAIRSFVKHPAFTAISALAVAIGIGASVVLLSAMNAESRDVFATSAKLCTIKREVVF
jgi:hypothetical protein